MNENPNLIPQASEVLISIKLKTNVDLLGTLIDEDLHKIYIEYPVEIKVIEIIDPESNQVEYHYVPRLWNQYSSRITVDLKKDDIFWFGPMGPKYMKLYANIVNTNVSTQVAAEFLKSLTKK